jgi:hypothetical protein
LGASASSTFIGAEENNFSHGTNYFYDSFCLTMNQAVQLSISHCLEPLQPLSRCASLRCLASLQQRRAHWRQTPPWLPPSPARLLNKIHIFNAKTGGKRLFSLAAGLLLNSYFCAGTEAPFTAL